MSILTLIDEVFQVRNNKAYPLESLIKQGQFRWVDPRIVPDRFPSSLEGPIRADVRVAAIVEGNYPQISDVMAWMHDHELRPASLRELLAVAALRPRVMRVGGYWSLDRCWKDSEGIARFVTCSLYKNRKLRLSCLEQTIKPGTKYKYFDFLIKYEYFLCVHK